MKQRRALPFVFLAAWLSPGVIFAQSQDMRTPYPNQIIAPMQRSVFDNGSTDPAAGDPLTARERQDFGIAESQGLHAGPMHGPTPVSIPGGQAITTKGLDGLVKSGLPFAFFDVLGGAQKLPGAIPVQWMAAPGSFDDAIQQQVRSYLQSVTRGRTDVPLVFYCQSTQCWLSYNAALRAINAGYRNVLWYRGGIEAWTEARMPLEPARAMSSPQ